MDEATLRQVWLMRRMMSMIASNAHEPIRVHGAPARPPLPHERQRRIPGDPLEDRV